VKSRKTGKADRVEGPSAGRSGNAAEHVVAADQMRHPMLADQRRRLRLVKLGLAYNMRTACDRRRRRGIAESAAKRYNAEHHGVGRVESDAARNIDRMPGDRLLIVENQFWSAGRT